MRGILLAAVLAVGLTGCAGIGGQSTTTVTETQVQTVTATQTGPPTYFKLDVVFNQLDVSFSLQVQAYTLDSKGQAVYSGAVRSLSVSEAERNTYGEADWPLCNDRMEGLRVKVVGRDGGIAQDLQWPGYHCTGAAKQYYLVIPPYGEMRLGAYTGNVQAPPRPVEQESAPNIQFTKDDTQDRLTVTTAESGANWNRLGLRASHGEHYFQLNDAASTEDTNRVYDNSYNLIRQGGSFPVQAGDFLDFCSQGAMSTMVAITVYDFGTAAVMGEYTFANIAAC